MNLDEIPAGSICAPDARILIYAEQGFSHQSQRLLRRIEAQEIAGILPQPVWQELIHRLMIMEAISQGHIRGANPSRQLASMPEIVKKLTAYHQKAKALVTLGLRYESCRESDLLAESLKMQEQYGLPPNDSLSVVIALRAGADILVSSDSRYREIQGIAVASPTDVVLGSSS